MNSEWYGLKQDYMKTKITLFPLLIIMTFLLGACSVNIKEKQIPFSATSFIKTHFPSATIDSIRESLDKEYYVLLSNGVELEFNHRGAWTEINSNKNELPQSVDIELPTKMLEYIAANYPNSRVKKIEKTFPGTRMQGYRVRLTKANNLELSFKKNGELAMKDPSDVKLPNLAQSFLDKHFSGEEVAFVEQERNRNYRVYFSNGIQVIFERKGICEDMVSKKKGLPESVLELLPRQAVEYVQTNYPNQKLLRMTKKSYGYKVRLGKPNEVNLSFSRVGTLVDDEFME